MIVKPGPGSGEMMMPKMMTDVPAMRIQIFRRFRRAISTAVERSSSGVGRPGS